jgi:hypothetical protein
MKRIELELRRVASVAAGPAAAARERMPQIAANLPHDLKEADELLTRFGRWAMDRYKKQHCASAEGHYKIPPNDDDRQPREVILLPADVAAINRALQGVPELQRVILQILYVPKRLPPQAQLRMLKIPPKLSQERHLEGVRMFWNRFRNQCLQSFPASATIRGT